MITGSNDTLDARLAALRAAAADAAPPPATDRAIAAAIARAQATRVAAGRAPSRWPAWTWPLAVAATIAAVAFVVRSPPPAILEDPLRVAAPAADDAFVPVVPLAEIERSGDALVVPARVPRTTLAQLGFPVNPAHAGDAIDAELLVRGDGSLLAVRFLP